MDYNPVSRVWLAGHGYQQVPPEVIRGRILYAHPEGRFVNKLGQPVSHYYTPNSYSQVRRGNKVYPQLCSHYGSKDCHYLMVCAFFHVPDRSKGEVIDHIDGNQLNYSITNLRIVDRPTNDRDGGFLKKLRNKSIDPRMFSPKFLLRFFDRMADFKRTHTHYQYARLTHDELLTMLVGPEFTVGNPAKIMDEDFTRHREM